MQPLQYLPGVWSMIIGISLMALMMRFCVRTGWVDKPDHRKCHVGAIPLAGGLSIITSFAITVFTFGTGSLAPGLTAAAFLVFVVGFIDDKHPMRARYRFATHLLAGMLLVLADGTMVHSLGDSFGPVPLGLGFLAIPFSIVAIAGVINAFNMVDGVDGLAGGQGFVSLMWFMIAAALIPAGAGGADSSVDVGAVLVPMLGAILAFLTFNMRTPWRARASVFLGDGGSMLIGLLVGWAAIKLTNSFGQSGMGPVSAVWVLAIPLIDMFSCIVRRVADGLTPMTADNKHMHHLLIARGMSANRAVSTMNLAAFVGGLIGVAGWLMKVPQYLLFWPLLAIFVAYLFYARRFWRVFEFDRLEDATLPAT